MIDSVKNLIYEFFIKSNDFNGIPLRQVSQELNINYSESIDLIKELVSDELVTIQSATNPHIIRLYHYPIEAQLKILEEAKSSTVSKKKIGVITFTTESIDYPICLYPSPKFLKEKRDLTPYANAEYTKQLALAEPHLKAIFFEIEVLDRYFNDPRFDFKFEDYSGSISCKYDEENNPIVREEDQIFIQTFGLGVDENNDRVAVVYLRYLKDLTNEQ